MAHCDCAVNWLTGLFRRRRRQKTRTPTSKPEHQREKRKLFQKRKLIGAVGGWFKPKSFIALVKDRRIPYHEKKDGQLFCDKSAKEIIDLLVTRAEASGAKLLLNQKVQNVAHSDNFFTVQVEDQIYQAPRLVVATGGLSWPQLGASDLGFKNRPAIRPQIPAAGTITRLSGSGFP